MATVPVFAVRDNGVTFIVPKTSESMRVIAGILKLAEHEAAIMEERYRKAIHCCGKTRRTK